MRIENPCKAVSYMDIPEGGLFIWQRQERKHYCIKVVWEQDGDMVPYGVILDHPAPGGRPALLGAAIFQGSLLLVKEAYFRLSTDPADLAFLNLPETVGSLILCGAQPVMLVYAGEHEVRAVDVSTGRLVPFPAQDHRVGISRWFIERKIGENVETLFSFPPANP